MRLFRLARRPAIAIRIALLGMLLALGLNTFAHASHSHDDLTAAAATLHAKACGYCSAFGALTDAPRTGAPALWKTLLSLVASPAVDHLVAVRIVTSTQPRAPPRN